MVAHSISLAPPLRKPAQAGEHLQGFGRGTLLRSVFGLRPVERLIAGDLLLDAEGQINELRAIRQMRAAPGDMVRLVPSESLPGLSKPLIVGVGQKLELRDWRTELLYGQGAVTRAARMVDGQHVRHLATPRQLYQLSFDVDCVILANGLPAVVHASAQRAQHRGQCLGQVLRDQAGADLPRGLDMQPGTGCSSLGGWQPACHQPGDQPGQHIA
ncbi:MAG: hypothetical protein EA407_08855 [Rhodobacteraceae bacterium]|nr:MAG: hypothetical protein EA407_08855 [Paracoccaceae bacterium]